MEEAYRGCAVLKRAVHHSPTIHAVTLGVAHVETGSLDVGRKYIPPLVLITEDGLRSGWTPFAHFMYTKGNSSFH